MRCPYCGAWSMVLATRQSRRKRRCGNEHVFFSNETVEHNPRHRNKQIVERVAAGASPEAVAASFHMPLDEVSAILAGQ